MRLIVEYDQEQLKKSVPDLKSGALRYLGFRLAAYAVQGEFDNADATCLKQMGIQTVEFEE